MHRSSPKFQPVALPTVRKEKWVDRPSDKVFLCGVRKVLSKKRRDKFSARVPAEIFDLIEALARDPQQATDDS